jgi:hypothetical protein
MPTRQMFRLTNAKLAGIQRTASERHVSAHSRLVRRGVRRQANLVRSYLGATFQHGAKSDHDAIRLAREEPLWTRHLARVVGNKPGERRDCAFGESANARRLAPTAGGWTARSSELAAGTPYASA